MHELIHDKGGARHIARILHQRDEEIEDQNLRQEDNDRAYTAYDTIYQHGLERTIGHRRTYLIAYPRYKFLNPVHGILAQRKGGFEHDVEHEEENGESEVFMREDAVDQMGGTIGVFFGARLVFSFFQRTMNKAVLGVHDSRLGIVARFFFYTGRSLVARMGELVEVLHALFASHVMTQIIEHLTIVLEQLQCQEAGRVVLGNMFVGLQIFLDMTDTVFYFVAIVDMQVARGLAGTFVHLNNGTEKFLHAIAILKRRGYHRHTKQGAEGFDIHLVATTLKLVVHIQSAHHADVHIYQLGGQIEVTLQVRGIDDIDNDIGHLFCKMFAHVELFRRIA